MKKRIISFILASLMLAGLAGCNDTPAPADTEPQQTDPAVGDIVLTLQDAKYTIIRPEHADDDTIKVASSLKKQLITMMGGDFDSMSISDDWVKRGDESYKNSYEILIGMTNRDESALEKEALPGYLDYSVTVRGNKICIFAHTVERLTEAVDYFLANTAFEDGNLIYRGRNVLSEYNYPSAVPDICGVSAREYVIVIPEKASDTEKKTAEALSLYLAQNTGALLDIVPDTASPIETEILIGDVDRPEAAQIKKEGYKLVANEKKLIISAESPAYYYAAKDLFINKIKEEGKIEEGIKLEMTDSAMDFFLKDNYASGLIKDEVNLAVQAMLSCLEYFNDRMVYGSKNLGERWVYSNRGANAAQTGYFDDMLKSSKKGGNCASPVNWALTEMGIVPKNDRFYGGSSGDFKSYSGDARTYLAPYCEVIDMFDSPVTFKELYRQGKVKAGDIFLCKHHTFVYRGDKSFYAAGHDGAWHTEADAPTEDERKAVFDNWVLAFDEVSETGEKVSGKYNANYNYTVYYIVRLKDDVIPEYYRNKEGELVKNPMIAE